MSAFDELIFDENEMVEIAGVQLKQQWWETSFMRRLTTNVSDNSPTHTEPITYFTLHERSDGQVNLTANAKGKPEYTDDFESLTAACEALKLFTWEIREVAGIELVKTRIMEIGSKHVFTALLSPTDKIEIVFHDFEGCKHISRSLDSQYGFIRADWYANSDVPNKSFAEGVAFALSMPTVCFSVSTTHQDAIKYQAEIKSSLTA